MVDRTSIRIIYTSKVIADIWSFYSTSVVDALALVFHTFTWRAEIRVLGTTAISKYFRAVFPTKAVRTTLKFWNSTLIGLLVAFFERSDAKAWGTHKWFFKAGAAREFLTLWVIWIANSIGAESRFGADASVVYYFFAFFGFRFFFFEGK